MTENKDYKDAIVIIPTLNEEENIGKIIDTLVLLYPTINILIVDDQSRDKTQEIVKGYHGKNSRVNLLARTGVKGYGHSILDGLRYAAKKNFKVAISMDSDFSHDPNIVKELHELVVEKDCAMAIGSRYVPGGGVHNWPLRRRILSMGSNLYVRAILGMGVHDTTSGYVAYSQPAITTILANLPESEGYSFLVETKFWVHKEHGRICEYPIIFTDRREGQSKMSLDKIWEAIWVPWKLLPQKLR